MLEETGKKILEGIRRRPAMYLGSLSLSAFWHFTHGYSVAVQANDIPASALVPREFHDWVAYRTHHRESTSGWCNMILAGHDEASGFWKFFDYLDEYHSRQPKLVARMYNADMGSIGSKDLTQVEKRKPCPLVEMVIYTDDPGFFLRFPDYPGETERFFRGLDWPFIPKGEWEIVDKDAFEHIKVSSAGD